MRRILGIALTLMASAPAWATEAGNDIVDTAVSAGSFNTLVAAVKAAGLVDTLKSPGPFTVFAPTDEAFAKLPAGTVESLLKPENKDKLTSILTYHVVPGKVLSPEVVKLNGSSVKTVQGGLAPIKVVGNTVMVGPARVVKTDIETSNGVIHVIDTVLIPPAAPAAPAAVSVIYSSQYHPSAIVPAPIYVTQAQPMYAAPAYAAPAYRMPAQRSWGWGRSWGMTRAGRSSCGH